MIFRICLLEDADFIQAQKPAAKGVSRIFRCDLFEESLAIVGRRKPSPRISGGGAGSSIESRGRMIGPLPKPREIPLYKPAIEELDLELVAAAVQELESDF